MVVPTSDDDGVGWVGKTENADHNMRSLYKALSPTSSKSMIHVFLPRRIAKVPGSHCITRCYCVLPFFLPLFLLSIPSAQMKEMIFLLVLDS